MDESRIVLNMCSSSFSSSSSSSSSSSFCFYPFPLSHISIHCRILLPFRAILIAICMGQIDIPTFSPFHCCTHCLFIVRSFPLRRLSHGKQINRTEKYYRSCYPFNYFWCGGFCFWLIAVTSTHHCQ